MQCKLHSKKYELFDVSDDNNHNRLLCLVCLMTSPNANKHEMVLIEQFIKSDQQVIQSLFDKYLMAWQKNNTFDSEAFKEKMIESMEQRNQLFIAQVIDIMEQRIIHFKQVLDITCSSISKQASQDIQTLQSKMEQFVQSLDSSQQQIIDSSQQQITTVDNSQQQQEQIKKQFDQFRNNNELKQISHKIDNLINQIDVTDKLQLNLISQSNDELLNSIDRMLISQTKRLSILEKQNLRDNNTKGININQVSQLNQYYQQIQSYLQNKESVSLYLDLWQSVNTLDHQQQIINWLDEHNLYQYVHQFGIKLGINSSEYENNLLDKLKLCVNVYDLRIGTQNKLDQSLEQKMFKLVSDSELLFLMFYEEGEQSEKQHDLKRMAEILIEKEGLDSLYLFQNRGINQYIMQKRQKVAELLQQLI